ncbi:hypothetical protein NC652_017299 [Populus alba x Populus x berolinensis]|nr:hypothetical protein NC652_017299 [Populus alba x Populus x berolinensis]
MGCMHDMGKCQVLVWLRVWTICSYKFQPTNMTSFLCCA